MSHYSNTDLAALLGELGHILTRKGDWDRAQLMLDGLLELAPDHASGHLLYGMYHFGRGDYSAAEKSYRASLDKDDSALARAFLAESLIPQKRYREAEKALQQVVRDGGDDVAVALAKSLADGLTQGVLQRSAVR